MGSMRGSYDRVPAGTRGRCRRRRCRTASDGRGAIVTVVMHHAKPVIAADPPLAGSRAHPRYAPASPVMVLADCSGKLQTRPVASDLRLRRRQLLSRAACAGRTGRELDVRDQVRASSPIARRTALRESTQRADQGDRERTAVVPRRPAGVRQRHLRVDRSLTGQGTVLHAISVHVKPA